MERSHKLLSVPALLLLALSSNAYSLSCRPYIGFGGGVNSVNWKYDNDITNVDQIDKHYAGRGLLWTGYGGCQLQFDSPLTIDLEVFGGTSNNKFYSTSSSANSDEFMDLHNNIGFSVAPGWDVYGQNVYARFGANWSRLRYDTNVNSTTPSQENFKFKKHKEGMIVGTGISGQLSSHFALRNEYDFSYYGTTTQSNAGKRIKFSPTQDAYTLALTFYFTAKPVVKAPFATPPSGFYAGMGFGRDDVRMLRRQSVTAFTNQGMTGESGRVIGGYDIGMTSRFKLGIEATASYSSAKFNYIKPTNSALSYRYDLKDLYTLKEKLGIKTSDTNEVLLFAGAAAGRIEKSGAGVITGNNFDKYSLGWLGGVGDQMNLTKNLAYRIEGDYIRLDRIKGIGSTGNQYQWTPKILRSSFSLIYMFS